jgi:hypothetical protein
LAKGLTGIQAPLIVHRFADGTVGYATGTVSAQDIAGAGSGAPVAGFVGDVLLPTALIVQQIALNAALPGVGRVALGIASAAQQIEQSARTNMALNLSGILGAVGQAVSGVNTSGFGNISQILGTGLNIASAAFAPTPVSAAVPTYGPAPRPVAAPTYAVQTLSTMPTIVGSMSLVRQITAPILFKMYQTLGKKYSLAGAIGLIKKLGKFFSSPEAIALYIGISVSEMASLITSNAGRTRRRMNPANTRALRRSLRRLKSFDRLSSRVSAQLRGRSTRRGYSKARRCGTCRSNPCSC